MAITKPAGGPGHPEAGPGASKEARSDKSYGTVRAGFGLNSGGMDSVIAKGQQVREGRGSVSVPGGSAGIAKP